MMLRKRIQRFAAAFLAALLLAASAPLAAFSADADLTIGSYAELKAFADAVNGGDDYADKLVRLDVNVELGGESNPWTPIGTSSNPFRGTFDGNYHVVSGLYIASGSSVGLFGCINGGTVKNLVVDGSVTGSGNVAAVVGKLTGGAVENCGSRASVSGGNGVAGVVGYASGSYAVSGCFNAGAVTGTGYVGGVAASEDRKSVV